MKGGTTPLPMSPCAAAYVAEYGRRPANREEQDRYSAFRFGFEAGVKQGSKEERSRIIRAASSDSRGGA